MEYDNSRSHKAFQIGKYCVIILIIVSIIGLFIPLVYIFLEMAIAPLSVLAIVVFFYKYVLQPIKYSLDETSLTITYRLRNPKKILLSDIKDIKENIYHQQGFLGITDYRYLTIITDKTITTEIRYFPKPRDEIDMNNNSFYQMFIEKCKSFQLKM